MCVCVGAHSALTARQPGQHPVRPPRGLSRGGLGSLPSQPRPGEETLMGAVSGWGGTGGTQSPWRPGVPAPAWAFRAADSGRPSVPGGSEGLLATGHLATHTCAHAWVREGWGPQGVQHLACVSAPLPHCWCQGKHRHPETG